MVGKSAIRHVLALEDVDGIRIVDVVLWRSDPPLPGAVQCERVDLESCGRPDNGIGVRVIAAAALFGFYGLHQGIYRSVGKAFAADLRFLWKRCRSKT